MQHIPNNVIESPLTAKIGLPGSEENFWPLPTNTKTIQNKKQLNISKLHKRKQQGITPQTFCTSCLMTRTMRGKVMVHGTCVEK
jgi:hypothetical protein